MAFAEVMGLDGATSTGAHPLGGTEGRPESNEHPTGADGGKAWDGCCQGHPWTHSVHFMGASGSGGKVDFQTWPCSEAK